MLLQTFKFAASLLVNCHCQFV